MNKDTGKIDMVNAGVIIAQLLTQAAGVRYGSVSVSIKFHDERLVEVSYSKTEHTRDPENPIFRTK